MIEKNPSRGVDTNDGKLLESSSSVKLMARAFMRRLRKQKVIGEATINDLVAPVSPLHPSQSMLRRATESYESATRHCRPLA